MKKVISVINQKGGVGKTTTTLTLAAGLALKGYRVLLIDMDAQGNTSLAIGADKTGATILEVLKKEIPMSKAIQSVGGLDVVPADISLAGADMSIIEMGKEYRLKEAMEPVKGNYDYCIIDTPPALGILTINALTASTGVIIPTQADAFSVDAIGQLYRTISTVKQYTNRDLMVEGILLTRHSDRTVLSRDITDIMKQAAEGMASKVFSSTVREAVAIKESQAKQVDIFTYAPNSKVAKDYMGFVDEFLRD